MDMSKIKEDWENRGFSCDIWTDRPGQVWKDFVHPVDELVMLIEGEIEISFQGKTLRPEQGKNIHSCRCLSYGKEHRKYHKPLVLWLQKILKKSQIYSHQ